MYNIREVRARREKRRQVALACAKALEGFDGLHGARPGYTLYLQVPASFLSTEGDQQEQGSVDLLFCRARDGLAALACVFDIGGDRAQAPDRLGDLKVRRFALPDGPGQAEMAAEMVRKAVTELPADTSKVSGSVTLDTRPLRLLLIRQHISLSKDALVRGQMLYPDGAVTPYGAGCGLVLRRCRERGGVWADEPYVLCDACGVRREVLRALRFSRKLLPPSRITLRQRLAAAENGVPADEAYPAHMAALLDKLMDAPVWDILEDAGVLEQARQLLPDCAGREATYGGALGVVHDLTRRFLEDGQDRRLYDLAGDILALLLEWLLRGPIFLQDAASGQQCLAQRLAGLCGTPVRALIAAAPLNGYLQGASARLGTGYPLAVCRKWTRDDSNSIKHMGRYLINDWYKENCESKQAGRTSISRPFLDMYGLLAEIILPDVEMWQRMNGKTSSELL